MVDVQDIIERLLKGEEFDHVLSETETIGVGQDPEHPKGIGTAKGLVSVLKKNPKDQLRIYRNLDRIAGKLNPATAYSPNPAQEAAHTRINALRLALGSATNKLPKAMQVDPTMLLNAARKKSAIQGAVPRGDHPLHFPPSPYLSRSPLTPVKKMKSVM